MNEFDQAAQTAISDGNPAILDYATPRSAAERAAARGKGAGWGRFITVAGSVVLGLVLLVSIMLPALCSAKEPANRVKCASNLRQIGQGILLYANDHRGAYPARLEELIVTTDMNAEVFICPSTNDDKAAGNTLAEIVAEFKKPGHCSYIYLGANLSGSSPAQCVVAYEIDKNHDGDGMNVLYNDGHVEWIVMREAKRIVEELKAGHNPPRAAE